MTARATLTKPVSCGSLSVSLWASWQWLLQCKLYWCADSADIDLRGLVVTTPPSRPPPLPVNRIPALSPPSRDRCSPNPRRLLETCLSPLARFLRRRLLWRKVTSVPLWKGKKTPKDKVFKHFFFFSGPREQTRWLCTDEYSSAFCGKIFSFSFSFSSSFW